MKTLLLTISLITLSATCFADPRQSQYNGRITINYGNGDNREYIEARFCGTNPNPPAPPSDNNCILQKNDKGTLIAISNSLGQTLPEVPNENGLNKLQRAVSSGFCSLSRVDFCSKTETTSNDLSNCTPRRDTIQKFYVNDVMITIVMTPSRCTYSDGTKDYGNPNYAQDVARYTAILKNLCPNNNL